MVECVHECSVNTLKIKAKLKKYSQCIITIDNDYVIHVYLHILFVFSFFLSFLQIANGTKAMNDLHWLHSFGGHRVYCEYVRIIMRICFPSFSRSAVDSTPPTSHDMTWLRCESKTGAKWLAKRKKTKWKWNEKGIKEWNNLPNERSTEKWQGNQQLLTERGRAWQGVCTKDAPVRGWLSGEMSMRRGWYISRHTW